MRALLRLGPYALLAATGAWAAVRWDTLPVRYPVHWGAGGPDRWTDLSPRSVGVPLLMGLLLVAWMGWLGRFVLANSAPSPDPARARRLVRTVSVAGQWTLALVFSAAAWPKQGPALVVVAAAAGVLLVPVALVVTYAGKFVPEPEVPAPPGGWLLVQRSNGTGLSIDPRHPGFKGAVFRFVAGPVAVVLLALLM